MALSYDIANMEFLFSAFVLFCVTYLCLHFLILKHKANLANQKQFPLPPGTTGWPILGETLDYFTKLKNGTLDRFVSDRINKYSSKSVFRTSVFGQPMAILPGVEGNKLLFSNENKLVQAWWPSSLDKIFPKSSNQSSREEFLKISKILHSSLKADVLRTSVGFMDEIMKQNLQKYWNNRKEIKVGEVVKKYTFTLACQVVLGIEDPQMLETLAGPIQDIAAGTVAMPIDLPGTALHHAIKSSKLMQQEIEKIIRRKKIELLEEKLSPKQDVLSHMLVTESEDGQFMSEADIASHIAGLLTAAFDTLNSSITFIMKYLAELPDVYDEVLKEQMEIAKSKEPKELLNWDDTRKMRYSWNVANEVLRLMPPVFGGFKEAITDFTYGGYMIPKGWKLHWIAYITQKNPLYFPNPEKFDPSRFQGNRPPPYTFVPFGAGPRMCPGNEYARLVILVFVHNVVTKFRWEKLLPTEKVVTDPTPRPIQGLPIRLHPHKP